MSEFKFEPALIHLIIGYGNARFDQGVFQEREDRGLLHIRAKQEADELLQQIQDRLWSKYGQ